MTITFQPCSAHSRSCSWSRQTFRVNFAFQNARFDFGAVACAHAYVCTSLRPSHVQP